MEFRSVDYQIPSPSVDIGINFGNAVGGEIFRPPGSIDAPNRPPNVYETGAEYIRKSRAVNEAVQQQHRIDSIYERVMGTAPPREVEVLPPDDPREVFSRPTMKSARPPDAMPVDVSSVYNRPSTPKTSGARRAVTIDVVPTSAEIVQPPMLNDPTPGAKPAGIPSPLGRYGMPLAGLAVDTTFRLAAGQPIEQAVGASAISTAGGLAGSIVGTAVAGPIGGFLGGLAGGWVAGNIADFAFGLMRPNSTEAHLRQVEPKQLSSPLRSNFNPNGIQLRFYSTNNRAWFAPIVYDYVIVEFLYRKEFDPTIRTDYAIAWWATDRFPRPDIHKYTLESHGYYYPNGAPYWRNGSPNVNFDPTTLTIQPAPSNTAALTPQQMQQDLAAYPYPPYTDNRTPQSLQHPLNKTPVPSASLEAGKPNIVGIDNYAPGGLKHLEGGTIRGDSPYWVKPATLNKPSPEHAPSNLGGDLPTEQTTLAPTGNLQAPNLTKPDAKNQTIPNTNSPTTRSRVPRPGGNFTQLGSPTPTVSRATPNLTKRTPQPTNAITTNTTITNITNVISGDNITNLQQITNTIQQNQVDTNIKLDKLMEILKCLDLFDNPNLCDKLKEMTQGPKNKELDFVNINVPTVVCIQTPDGTFKPQRYETTIQVLRNATGSEITQVSRQFEEQAKIAESACYARNQPPQQTANVTLGIPEHWHIRPDAKRPQLLVIFGGRNLNSKQWDKSRWQVAIPHPNFRAQQLKRLRFPPREMGIHGAWAVLKDESLVRVFMSSEDKAIRYVSDLCKKFVSREMWPTSNPLDWIQTGRRPGIEKQMVYPFKVEYHSQGIVRGAPDDEYYFP